MYTFLCFPSWFFIAAHLYLAAGSHVPADSEFSPSAFCILTFTDPAALCFVRKPHRFSVCVCVWMWMCLCVSVCVSLCVSVCESACTHLCLHEGVHTESLGSGSRGPSTSSRVALRGLREGQAQLGQVWPGTAGLCSRSFGHHIHPQSSPGPTRGLVAGQEGVGASKHDPEGLSYRTSDPPAPPLAAQGQRTGRGTLNSLLAEGQAP